MTRTVRSTFALAIVLSVAACTSPSADVPPPPPAAASSPAPAAADRLTVYKSLGRKQCEAGGETPDTLAGQLTAAGVEATPAGCATDGMMYAAVCGGGDGILGLLDIAASDAAAAAQAGFRPFSDLPDASRIPCPDASGADSKK